MSQVRPGAPKIEREQHLLGEIGDAKRDGWAAQVALAQHDELTTPPGGDPWQLGEQAGRVTADALRAQERDVERAPVDGDPQRPTASRSRASTRSAYGPGAKRASARSRARAPMRARVSRSSRSGAIAAASAAGLRGETSTPVPPSTTTSLSPPTCVATTGTPCAAASAATVPNGSACDGTKTRSNSDSAAPLALRQPAKTIRSITPLARAAARRLAW